jgi:uncharacterized protein GlcG (DUF336 family)
MRFAVTTSTLALAVVLLGAAADAQQPTPPAAPAAPLPAAAAAPYGTPITIDQAKAAAAAAVAEANKNNWNYAVAIVEPNGALVYFERMEGTQYSSANIAENRARASARFRRPTKAFADRLAQNDLTVFALEGAVPSEGGVPIIVGGKLIGAIGASGGTQPQDGQVAKAGADAVK